MSTELDDKEIRVERSICSKDFQIIKPQEVHKKMEAYMGRPLGSPNEAKDIRDYAFVHMIELQKKGFRNKNPIDPPGWGAIQKIKFGNEYSQNQKDIAYGHLEKDPSYQKAFEELKEVQDKRRGCWFMLPSMKEPFNKDLPPANDE